MDYTKLSLINCVNLACSEFGLEDEHTIAIAKLVDFVENGYLTKDEATSMAQIIYHHGTESLYYNDEWDGDSEPDYDECGFNPYAGCYDWDC